MEIIQKKSNTLQKNLFLNIQHLLNTSPPQQQNSFNQPPSQQQQCSWKILIYDNQCQESLSTIFKVGDLREQNVTLYLNLTDKKREQIHGVDAVYFITPIQENIDQIVKDVKNDLYDQIHINFAYPIEKKLLQKLAQQIGKLQLSYKIKSVKQHALSFITLNSNLFTFNLPNIYSILNSQQQLEHQQTFLEKLAINLYSVCRTLKTIPTIVYHSDSPIQKQLCEQLEKIFKEQMQQQQIDISQQLPYTLILYNRNSDLGSALYHPWHYGALIHDQIHIKNNKIELDISTPQQNQQQQQQKQHKIYDLDPQNDSYWSEKINYPLKDILEDAPQQVEKYTREYEKLLKKSSNQDYQEQQNQINNALNQVTVMKETKNKLEMHTNIANFLAQQVQKKELILTYDLAQDLINQNYLQKEDFNQFEEYILSQQQSEQDKLRLLIIYLLYCNTNNDQFPPLLNQIKDPKNQQILQYIQQLAKKTQQNQSDSKREMLFTFAKNMAKRALKKGENDNQYIIQLLKQITQNSNLLEQSVSNTPNLQLYEIVPQSSLNKPKFNNPQFGQQSQQNSNINNFIVFCLEGHTLNEYQALCEFEKKYNKNIVFGGSSLLSATDIMDQISQLQQDQDQQQ